MRNSGLIIIGRIIAILMIVLGIIHEIATFSPMIGGAIECLDKRMFDAMVYMSLMCGALFILCGLLLFLMLGKVQEIPYLHKPILIISTLSNLAGVLAVMYMTDNPFAWIGFILGLSMFITVLLLRRKII